MHLILGMDTSYSVEPSVAEHFAKDMIGVNMSDPMTIENAWYDAGQKGYHENFRAMYVSPTKFVVVGDVNCFQDYLQTETNTALSGTWTKSGPTQVFP
jgi:hypothetical protein